MKRSFGLVVAAVVLVSLAVVNPVRAQVRGGVPMIEPKLDLVSQNHCEQWRAGSSHRVSFRAIDLYGLEVNIVLINVKTGAGVVVANCQVASCRDVMMRVSVQVPDWMPDGKYVLKVGAPLTDRFGKPVEDYSRGWVMVR